MKKIVFACVFCIVSLSAVFSQVSVDPNDRFYSQAQIWEVRGLVDRLPQIRPYPLNLIRQIIESIIEVGINDDGTIDPKYQSDVEVALYEYERIFSHSFHLQGTGGGRLKIRQNQQESEKETAVKKFIEGKGAVVGDVALHPLVSFSYNIGEYGNIGNWGDVGPDYTNFAYDSIQDAADIGPLSMYFDANSNISVGTAKLYATAGMSRAGFGPFLGEGLCLNETSYHSANMFINATGKFLSFTTLFSAIGATTNVNTSESLASSKYFALHSLRFTPFKWLAVSFYESVVFGGRTEFLYLIPAPFMVVQGLGGNHDNLQMGLLFEYDMLRNLRLNLDIFVDDMDAEKLAKLKLDGKNRFGVQAGFMFTPPESFCKLFAMNYTIITPYTYSHWECTSDESGEIKGTSFNYQNYTNNGINIGSTLQPDSDRVGFSAQFQPKKNLRVTLSSNFIRHQNVVESLSSEEAGRYMIAKSGTYRTDGSVYTHSMFSDETSINAEHVDSAWSHLLFMSGDHCMHNFQAGLSAEYEIPTRKRWRITLKAGYMFEYVHNKGVDSNIYPGSANGYTRETDSEGNTTYSYVVSDGTKVTEPTLNGLATNEKVQKDVQTAYDNWVSQLYDQVNNYFSLSVKITY
ncbi:MAG: hypothetical protein IJP62_11260 [Treponema sp.]|nr:hypothetical protein [Treponema sp.]